MADAPDFHHPWPSYFKEDFELYPEIPEPFGFVEGNWPLFPEPQDPLGFGEEHRAPLPELQDQSGLIEEARSNGMNLRFSSKC